MNSSEKKISFSFSKVKKPSLTIKTNKDDGKEKIEYVDCFDGSKGKFSYKGNVRNEVVNKKELVIPMVTTRSGCDIKQRIEEKLNLKANVGQETNLQKTDNGLSDSRSKSEISIDEIAAAEILSEIKDYNKSEHNSNGLIITHNNVTDSVEEQPIDYDNVPVVDFGKAMLRGMGWKPDSGIGKEPRLVPTVSPKLRPKGLGLGAKPKVETNDKKSQ